MVDKAWESVGKMVLHRHIPALSISYSLARRQPDFLVIIPD